MRATILIAGLLALFAPSAQAQDLGGTLQLELANVGNEDPSWDLFNPGGGMPSRGVRGGVRIGENLNILAGWHRVRRGASVYVPSNNPTEDDYRSTEVVMAFFADELSLGAQAGLPIGQVLFPYVAVDGMLMRGVVRLDEDSSTRRNPGQVVGSGTAPGLLAMGGLQVRSPTEDAGLQIGAHLEVGRSWFSSANFGDLGEMRPGGFTVRGGLGVLF